MGLEDNKAQFDARAASLRQPSMGANIAGGVSTVTHLGTIERRLENHCAQASTIAANMGNSLDAIIGFLEHDRLDWSAEASIASGSAIDRINRLISELEAQLDAIGREAERLESL